MTEAFDDVLADVGDDLEEILAAESDGIFDLSPLTKRWLLAALDELKAPAVAERAAR